MDDFHQDCLRIDTVESIESFTSFCLERTLHFQRFKLNYCYSVPVWKKSISSICRHKKCAKWNLPATDARECKCRSLQQQPATQTMHTYWGHGTDMAMHILNILIPIFERIHNNKTADITFDVSNMLPCASKWTAAVGRYKEFNT